MRLFSSYRVLAAFLCLAALTSSRGQVVINEVSAAQNDRLLQYPSSKPARLGNLPSWQDLDFAVPSFWKTGAGPLGFGYTQTTNVSASVFNKTPSLYLRRSFEVTAAQADGADSVELVIDYDDGFVAFLNGVEVARRNTGAVGSYVWHDQQAFNSKPAGTTETIVLGAANTVLRSGENVLAIQVHNNEASNSRLYCSATLRISGASPQSLVLPSNPWRWFAGTSEPSGGLYDPVDFASVTPQYAPEFLDWIELKNTSGADVDLGGWTLTDSNTEPAKWAFASGTTIPAGGYLVVASTGRNVPSPGAGGLRHTSFSLNSRGEYLALRDPGGILRSEVDGAPDQNPFHTWGKDADTGDYRYLPKGTPGAANVAGAASDIAAEVDFDKATGFHTAPLTIALSTATPGATIRYTLDGTEPTESSPAYSGPFDPMTKPAVGPGEGSILREMFQWSTGTIVRPANLPANATPTSSQLMTQLETPSNVSDYYTHRVRGFLHAPESGNYQFWLATDDDGELWLSTNDSPSTRRRIAYINGWVGSRDWNSNPTGKSVVIPLVAGQKYYIEALQSEGGGGDNLAVGWSGPGLPGGINVIEGRYLSPPATLPPGTTTPPGAATVRARAFAPGMLPGEVRTRNYVTGYDPRLATVPAIFLSGPPEESFYAPNGIFTQVGGGWPAGSWTVSNPRYDYNYTMVSGRAFERPVAFELVNPGNQIVERTNVGARFAGSPWSRPQYQLKGIANTAWNGSAHSKPQLNIFFRGDFGISTLEKPGLIPTSTVKKWDTLRLRAGKNDPYNPFIVDEWMRRTFAEMGAPSPQGFFATLFINGQFKSYFNPTERPRGDFFREFYRTSNLFDINYIGEWEEGDPLAYSQMLSFFRNNDFTSLNAYQQGARLWDMANVADYIILNAWAGTQDWPHNNYVFQKERVAGARWHFSMWDAEGAIGRFGQSTTHNTFESELHVSSGSSPGSESNTTALVFRRARQNPEFRLLFADRIQKHFFNDGVMARTNLNTRWNGLRAQVEPLIGAVFGGGFDNSSWNSWSTRDATFLSQARTAGLWPVTSAPRMTPFGGSMGAGGAVTLTNPNAGGVIHYTTDGSDPRAVGGAVVGAVYASPIPISSPTTVKARVRAASGEWSPLVEASFASPTPRLLVTELHYNPPGPDDATEFIEITNLSNVPASLNGAHFTQGLTYTFGNVTLAPGEQIVLVKDQNAFAAAYPGAPVGGVFTGSLDNAGETITLNDIAGATILSFSYGDSNIVGWPSAPDGDGRTLVLRRPFHTDTDPNLASSWRPSAINHGAPGQVDSTRFTGDPMADLDADGYLALVEYAFGSSDTSADSRPAYEISTEESGALIISATHPLAAEDVIVDAVESSGLTTWTPATLIEQSQSSGASYRSMWRSTATGDRVFLRLRVRQQ